MRIALYISGYLRGLKENIESIKKNIIQDNFCDIYIHITEDDCGDKYLNKHISYDYIKNTLSPKLVLITNNIMFSNNIIINNLLNQNYKFFWLNEERKKICQIENINYDVIVKIRPDLNIKHKLKTGNKIYFIFRFFILILPRLIYHKCISNLIKLCYFYSLIAVASSVSNVPAAGLPLDVYLTSRCIFSPITA